MAPKATRSGMHEAGRIMLLAGGILSGVLAVGFGFVGWTVGQPLLFVLSVVLLAGCVCSLLAWRNVGRGDAARAFALGLAGSLLPPVQLITLIGAILVRLSPEAQASTQAP